MSRIVLDYTLRDPESGEAEVFASTPPMESGDEKCRELVRLMFNLDIAPSELLDYVKSGKWRGLL